MTTLEFATSLLKKASEVKMTLLQRPEGSSLTATFNVLECDDSCFLEMIWHEATPLQECLIGEKPLLDRANEFVRDFIKAGFEVFTSLTVHIFDSREREHLGVIVFEGKTFIFGDEQKRLVEEKCYR